MEENLTIRLQYAALLVRRLWEKFFTDLPPEYVLDPCTLA
jgi:hypothetical protein